MQIKKLIILNMADTSGNNALRSDFAEAFSEYESITYLETKGCVVEVASDGVYIVCSGSRHSFADSFVFIRRHGGQSALVALLCMLFKAWGIPFSDPVNGFHQESANKSFCIPRLALHGLPVPRTFVCGYAGLISNLSYMRERITYPCVIKGDGARGTRVFKIESEAALLEKARALVTDKPRLLTIQEFIPNTYDVRALFMGDILVGAMRRTATPGTFLNNVSQGGTPEPEVLSETELALCQKAVRHSELDFCGVDFIRTEHGQIVFLEINKSPQVNGIRTVNPTLSVGNALRTFIERL